MSNHEQKTLYSLYAEYKKLDRRAEITLHVNFALNAAYACYNGIFAIVFRSAWMGMLACYYLLLSVLRYVLTREIKNASNWGCCLFCGKMLLPFSIVLVGMSVLLQTGTKQIVYPGYMIYGVAAFTFFCVCVYSAIRNVIIYSRIDHPVYLASKSIILITAAVSLLSLQAALITAFGNDPDYARLMGRITGCAVFLFVNAIAVLMIKKGRYRQNHD